MSARRQRKLGIRGEGGVASSVEGVVENGSAGSVAIAVAGVEQAVGATGDQGNVAVGVGGVAISTAGTRLVNGLVGRISPSIHRISLLHNGGKLARRERQRARPGRIALIKWRRPRGPNSIG